MNTPLNIALFVFALSLVGFTLMGYDKNQAKHHRWRIPEKTLFGVALCGGSLGVLAGMYIFRHKTLHASFKFGIPVIILIQIAALVFFFGS